MALGASLDQVVAIQTSHRPLRKSGSHGKARLKRYNNSSAGARNRSRSGPSEGSGPRGLRPEVPRGSRSSTPPNPSNHVAGPGHSCGATRKASRRGNSRAPDQPHGPSRAYFGDVVKYVGQRKYTSRRIFMRYWLKGAIEPAFPHHLPLANYRALFLLITNWFSVASPRPEPFTQFFCPGLNLGIPKERDNGYCGLKSHDPDFEGYYMFAANLQSTNLGFNCTGKLRNSYWCCKGWVPYYNDPLNLVHEKDVRGMCSEHPQHN
ncbi:hypothetical protein KEM48_012971 [Puccinia striiformis f. sp. tritici PST-130]|nr:hypothetical protein KEM48_012971 [Puccinia striiformis f. sp. tritici PST-130]